MRGKSPDFPVDFLALYLSSNLFSFRPRNERRVYIW